MATLSYPILEAALQDGVFSHPPNEKQWAYLSPTVLTAWKIIDLISSRGDDGIDIESLAHNLGLNQNTVKMYCRWLRKRKLIDYDKLACSGSPLVYFPPKKNEIPNY